MAACEHGIHSSVERCHECETLHCDRLAADNERISAENVALRNFRDNVQPGPISEALAGQRYETESRLREEVASLQRELAEARKSIIAESDTVIALRQQLQAAREALKQLRAFVKENAFDTSVKLLHPPLNARLYDVGWKLDAILKALTPPADAKGEAE